MTHAIDRPLGHQTVVQIAGRRKAPWHWAKGWNAYYGTRTGCEIYLSNPLEASVIAEALERNVTCKNCLRVIAKGKAEAAALYEQRWAESCR